MAEEYERNGQRVVKARIARWKMRQEERRLFDSAEHVPNWRLADKARRLLADLTNHLSGDMPSIVGTPFKKVDRDLLKQAALVSAAAITVRAAGSGMAMIASGYLAESAGPARRGLEAKLNARAIVDDSSGEYAIGYLKGRSRSLQRLEQKYGIDGDMEMLSRLSHADVRGLSLLHVRPPKRDAQVIEGEVNIMPSRDDRLASLASYLLAYEAIEMCGILAEAFDFAFEIPPWVSGELQRQGEAFRKTQGASDS